ncbi:PucR family transcriptional regulator [Nocardioides plantarum]|uniref:PucR family transcriptional regulator n=1 Tax=Nocardioides plantarum TaxID=29299 RepID=A0ABV5K7N3_9ACTN|nr:helix-turn-helix domain-containing protein [Nocardioides plantarum]
MTPAATPTAAPTVNLRPRASLGRVLDDLGATLLQLVAGDVEGAPEIGGVVIHDPLDVPALPAGALVLAVGLEDETDVVALLRDLGEQGAAGLVLRAPAPVSDDVRRVVEATGVCLLVLSRGAPWAHLATMLRSLLAEGDIAVAGSESLGGLPSGDLFAVANAIASLLDAPVTIEDRRSRVLAFSGRQDEADPSRVETILGRQVPERYARALADQGVFRELHRTDRPVFVTPIPMDGDTFTRPRVAVAVRAGDEVLGSIWAAVPGPLSDERTEALCDAAKLVALHLLRVRAGADVQRRLRADLLSTALEGGVQAQGALDRLGLGGGVQLMVLGVAVTGSDVGAGPDDDAVVAHDRERLGDAFAVHLSGAHPRSAAALIGGVTYGLVPVPGVVDGAEDRAARIAQEFLDRVGDRRSAVVGIGPTAGDVTALAHSRACVDRVLRVLRDRPGGRPVARLADVHVESLMLEMRDIVAARGDRPEGALARLAAYDVQHRTNLVETLRAWLEAFGDVVAAAEGLFVHPNTFRYRLRRVAEVGGMDLDDPDVRYGALLQLRLLPPAAPASPAAPAPEHAAGG